MGYAIVVAVPESDSPGPYHAQTGHWQGAGAVRFPTRI